MNLVKYWAPFAVGALMVSSGPTNPPPQRRPPDCFRLTFGAWNRPSGEWQRVPPIIKLDTVPEDKSAKDVNSRMALRPSLYTGRRIWSTWKVISPDSIEMEWSNGFVSEHIRAQIKSDSLSGIVEAFSDVIEVGEIPRSASVAGIRIPCPEKFD